MLLDDTSITSFANIFRQGLAPELEFPFTQYHKGLQITITVYELDGVH